MWRKEQVLRLLATQHKEQLKQSLDGVPKKLRAHVVTATHRNSQSRTTDQP